MKRFYFGVALPRLVIHIPSEFANGLGMKEDSMTEHYGHGG